MIVYPKEREKAVTFAETLAHAIHIFSPKQIIKGNVCVQQFLGKNNVIKIPHFSFLTNTI